MLYSKNLFFPLKQKDSMDLCRKVSVSGGFPATFQPEQQLSSPNLDDLFSSHSMAECDLNTEWLSILVEDCLSSSGNCIPFNPQSTTSNAQSTNSDAEGTNKPTPEIKNKPHFGSTLSMHKLVVPCKARSKRKRRQFKGTSPLCWSQQLQNQTYWLAESELILQNKSTSHGSTKSDDYGQEMYKLVKHDEESGQVKRCKHCLSQKTPQWRAGPDGPKTLCNACGVRYKSGRLLPEYRPAKSPTFVSYKHSNSHKKVLQMRMCSSSSC